MSWLLVVQSDPVQADALRGTFRGNIANEVVVVESLDAALSLIDRRLPDVLLLPTLIPAAVEDYLLTYLGAIPGAGHVQILRLPHFECSDNAPSDDSPSDNPPHLYPHSFLRRRRGRGGGGRGRPPPPPPGPRLPVCDPTTFVRDVASYLAGVKAIKREIELGRARVMSNGVERRSGPRFASREVPWVSVVRLGNDRAELIDVSLRGALLQTSFRPEHEFLRRTDPNVRRRSRVTFELEWGREVHATGRVIRCVPSKAGDRAHYEIAFSFDDSVGLHLPSTEALVRAKRTAS